MKKTIKPLIALLFCLCFLSCSKDSSETMNLLFLIKAEKVATYTQQQLASVVSLAALSNPLFLAYVEKIQYGVTIYYVEYKTDYIQNSVIPASGLVVVPQTGGVPTMLLSFQNGTIVKNSDTPSQNTMSPDNLILYAAAGAGFTVCIADYIGFGVSTNKTHPYLNKSLFQRTIVNLIQAVGEMEESKKYGLTLSRDFYLAGYSLGGWASLVAHKYIEDYGIKGFNFSGSTCGAGAYNLIEMRDFFITQTDYVQPYYLPFLLWGFRSTGDIESDLSIYFREPYASRIPGLFNGLYSGTEINAQLTKDITQLLAEDFITDSNLPKFNRLNAALQNNSQYAWLNTNPIHFFHGTADLHVPYSISSNLVQGFRNLGQTDDMVQFTTLIEANHRTGSVPMFLSVLNKLIELQN